MTTDERVLKALQFSPKKLMNLRTLSRAVGWEGSDGQLRRVLNRLVAAGQLERLPSDFLYVNRRGEGRRRTGGTTGYRYRLPQSP